MAFNFFKFLLLLLLRPFFPSIFFEEVKEKTVFLSGAFVSTTSSGSFLPSTYL